MSVNVQVIVSFAIDGKMQPLYVAYEGETRKVLSTYVSHKDQSWITFECSIQIENTARAVRLHYSIRDHLWKMNFDY